MGYYKPIKQIIAEENEWKQVKARDDEAMSKTCGFDTRWIQLLKQRSRKEWSAVTGLPEDHPKITERINQIYKRA